MPEISALMKGLTLISPILLIMIGFSMISGCIDQNDNGEIDIVFVSISPLKEVVQRIAGNEIEVHVMVPEEMDPHTYSPTPSQLLKVSRADLFFKVGSGVEFEELNMNTIEESNSRMSVIDLSHGIEVVSFDDHGVHHSEEEELEDDHDHQGTDPHIWLDPNNMKIIAVNVLDSLKKADPENEITFQNNFEEYEIEIDELISNLSSKFLPYKDQEFLTYHPAWGYFADAFDLVQISVEDEGKEPGPQGITKIIDQANEHNITVIFVEPQFDSSSASQIADEIGGQVVTVDPLASDYIANLKIISQKMVNGFTGTS